MKTALKNSKKLSVKNNTDNKKNVQPTQAPASGSTQKTDKAVKVFKYETTFKRITLKDKKQISSLIKSESKDVKDRIAERGIKIAEVVKLSKYGHKQLLNGELKSTSMKFYFTLKNDKKICMNFRDYEIKK